jgi:hypothetical protein
VRTQKAIREFLKIRTSYDVLPMSFRLIILDTDLLIKKSLTIFIQSGTNLAAFWHWRCTGVHWCALMVGHASNSV